MNQVNLIKRILTISIGVAFGVLLLVSVVRAATYNFYFNNTEQGANSTASPNVTVNSDGKSGAAITVPSAPAPALAPASPAAPVVLETSGQMTDAEARSVARTAAFNEATLKFLKPFRFSFGAGVAQRTSHTDYPASWMEPGYDSTTKAEGGLVSMAYFFTDWLGANIFVGVGGNSSGSGMSVYGGGEFELVPVRLGLFGVKDFIQLAGLLGGSNVYNVSRSSSGAALEPHAGARLTLQFTEHWGLTAAARFILSKGDDQTNYITDQKTVIGEAGLTVRL